MSTYYNGQTPLVGDIIKVQNINGLDHYSPLKRHFNTNQKLVVLALAGTNIRVGLVGSKEVISTYKPDRFTLVERGANPVSNVPQTLIVDSTNKVVKVIHAGSQVNVTAALQELVLKNPTSVYHVFNYGATAKAKTPELEFVDKLATERVTEKAHFADDPTKNAYFRKI